MKVFNDTARAIKELLENAIDALANKIQLIIKDAGKTLILFIDNNIGLSPTDAGICIQSIDSKK